MFHSGSGRRSNIGRGFFLDRCDAYAARRRLATLAAVASVLTFSFAVANAAEPNSHNDNFSALRDYVQLIDAGRKAPSRESPDAYAELRSFAERIGIDQPKAEKTLPKLADADSLMDFLRGGGSTKPSAPPKKGPVAGGTTPSAPSTATTVGAKVCVTCHADQAEFFAKTLMGRINKTQKGKFDCENCHGPGSAHVNAGGGRGVGGIISFRPNDLSRTAAENNAICLACHERGDRTNWPGSVHDNRGLMCSNCHTIMKQVSRKFQLKTVFEPDTCFQCHKDRRAAMLRSSHMPLREGKMVCSDCHNPHGSFTEALLKKDSINDVCYTCHAEKRGPFLFEHLPVRENCDNCHDPHGSINEFSLKMSRPRLCFECHGAGHGSTSTLNSATTMGRACQNCHTYVHGSNAPAGGALQR